MWCESNLIGKMSPVIADEAASIASNRSSAMKKIQVGKLSRIVSGVGIWTKEVPLIRRLCMMLLLLVMSGQYGWSQTTDTIYGTDINTYELVLEFHSCEQYAVIDSAGSDLSAGDRVLLIQMQGCWSTDEDVSQFGDIETYGACGAFEFATIDTIVVHDTVHQRVYFETPPINEYTPAGGWMSQNSPVQMIRVPQYENVVVDTAGGNPELSPPSWNGSLYGVLVFEASGWVELLSDIRADGDGFRYGDVSSPGSDSNLTGYVYDISGASDTLSGHKGEAATDWLDDLDQGRGHVANGGGGGNARKAGGGGGANAGSGGRGGYQVSTSGIVPNGGLGGTALSYPVPQVRRAFLGGGGGGGHRRGDSVAGTGGRGGGIIIIRADTIRTTSNSIYTTGYWGDTSAYEGAGGGGAGGTILLDVNGFDVTPDEYNMQIDAAGGRGGSAWGTDSICHGPGGGGGGGFIGFSCDSTVIPTNDVTVRVTGGPAGTAINCTETSSVEYGSTAGGSGIEAYSIVLPGYFDD